MDTGKETLLLNSAYTVYDFMIKLGLKHTALLVFALIYSYTKDGEEWFFGSKQYIEKMTGAKKRSIYHAISYLIDRNLIERAETSETYAKYRVTGRTLRLINTVYIKRFPAFPNPPAATAKDLGKE